MYGKNTSANNSVENNQEENEQYKLKALEVLGEYHVPNLQYNGDTGFIQLTQESSATHVDNAIKNLISALSDDDAGIRRSATIVLADIVRMPKISEETLHSAIARLGDSSEEVRDGVMRALGEVMSESDKMTAALIKNLKEGISQTKPGLIKVIAHAATIKQGKQEAIGTLAGTVPFLVEALKDLEGAVREEAAYALLCLSTMQGAKEVMMSHSANLAESLKSLNKATKRYMARALGYVGNRSVVSALISALQDPDDALQRTAAEALGKVGAEAIEAIPDLIKMIKLAQSTATIVAADALAKIDKTGSKVPEITQLLESSSTMVKLCAIHALGEIGNASLPAVPSIIKEYLVTKKHQTPLLLQNTMTKALSQIMGIDQGTQLVKALDERNLNLIHELVPATRETLPNFDVLKVANTVSVPVAVREQEVTPIQSVALASAQPLPNILPSFDVASVANTVSVPVPVREQGVTPIQSTVLASAQPLPSMPNINAASAIPLSTQDNNPVTTIAPGALQQVQQPQQPSQQTGGRERGF